MDLELHEPTKDDIPAVVSLIFRGYHDDPLTRCLFPPSHEAACKEWSIRTSTESWAQDPLAHSILLCDPKAEDNDGRIVGVVKWDFEPPKDPASDGWKTKTTAPAPPHFDEKLLHDINRKNWAARVKAMGAEPYLYVDTVIVDPDHRRRGAGARLMHHVLSVAAAHNLAVYLASTPAGLPLYRSLGFTEVDSYPIDVSKATTEERRNRCMVFEKPRPNEPWSQPTPQHR